MKLRERIFKSAIFICEKTMLDTFLKKYVNAYRLFVAFVMLGSRHLDDLISLCVKKEINEIQICAVIFKHSPVHQSIS